MGLQSSFSASLSSYFLILAKLLERRAHQENCLHAILVCRILVALMIYCRNTSPTWSNYRVFYDPPQYKCWSSFWSAHTGATMRGATWAGHVRGCISTCQNSTIIMCNYAAVEKSRPWFGSSEWEVCLLLLPWQETHCQTFQPSIPPFLFFFFNSVSEDWTWINVSATVPMRCWNG